MRGIAIIGNPKAGAGGALESLRSARRELWGHSTDYFLPRTPLELQTACATLDAARHAAVVVVGGDGTTNLVIRELVRLKSAVPLYVFPGGTANDLAGELGTRADWGLVEKTIALGHTDLIDLIEVNGVPFVTVAGIGLGATLTHGLNELRESSALLQLGLRKLKRELYSLLAVKTILGARKIDRAITIEAGSFRKKLRTAALFVCNQKNLSGRMRMAFGADNTDGRFHVLTVEKASRARLIAGLLELRKGKIPENFISLSTDRLVVESSDGLPIRVFGDGETLVESRRLEFTVARRKLSVLRPRVEA